jgi:hypothetical protein
VAAGDVIDGKGSPIPGAKVSPSGVVVDKNGNSITMDAAGNPISVNAQGQLLNGNGTVIAGASIVNGTTVNHMMNPLVLDNSGQPLAVSTDNNTLTPLDALGNPIPGATFDAASKAASATGGKALPRDFSGDVVGLNGDGIPVDATPQKAPIPGAKVDTSGKVVVPQPGSGAGAPQTPVEIDGLGRAQPVSSSGAPLGPDGSSIPGLKISPTGQLVDVNGSPVTIDESGIPVSLDRVGGQPLPNQPIAGAPAPALAAATPVEAAPPTSTQAAGNNSAAGAQRPPGNDGYSILSSSAVAAVIAALVVLASIAL